MLTAIYVAILLLCLYVYARIIRDHRVYTKLLVCTALAFVIGSCVKNKILTQKEIIKSETAIASNPTNHLQDSTILWIENSATNNDLSQETKSDTIVNQTENLRTTLQNVAIEDDS